MKVKKQEQHYEQGNFFNMHFKDNVYTFDNLKLYPTITHAISTKAFGTMKKEDGSIHHANMMKFGLTAGVKSLAIAMGQIHSGNVAIVENEREIVVPNIDGLITNNKKLALAVVTADCLPILLYDPHKDVIAVVHAGSKGLLKDIIRNMMMRLIVEFGSDPKSIVVGIGPAIEQKCYEVGLDLIEQYKEALPSFKKIIEEKDGKYYLDLRAVAVQSLMKEGILEKNIEVADLCTKCNSDTLYSYRNGDTNGRFVSLIGFA